MFLWPLECYFGIHFPRCFATQELNTKITLSWALKQFVTQVHTLFSIYSLTGAISYMWLFIIPWWISVGGISTFIFMSTRANWKCRWWLNSAYLLVWCTKGSRITSSLIFSTLFVSLQSHFWLIRFPPISEFTNHMSALSSYMCSITPETPKISSRYSHMRGPGICRLFSNRSNCSHWSLETAVLPINPDIYTCQCESIIIFHSITLYLYCRYITMQPTLLTSQIQLLSYKV